MTNEFIIKINTDSKGRKLSLLDMPVEAVDALKIFIESLSEFAKLHNNNDSVRISLKDGSIESVMSYTETEQLIENEIGEILDGTSDNKGNVKIFKNIQDKVKQNGLNYSIIHRVDNVETDVTDRFKAKNFILKRGPRKEWKEEIIFVEGKLFNAGGKVKTNLHIEIQDDELTIECTRPQAKKVNSFLYDKLFLAIIKKTKANTKPAYTFVDSYADSTTMTTYRSFFEAIQSDDSLDRYDVIHDKIVSIINDPAADTNEILKIMRLYTYDSADRGIIRTILITIKPVLDKNKNLSLACLELAKILREGSIHNKI